MAISTDYSAPVWVNGFACRNCSEVDQAKRNVDPANPSAGPFGINKTGRSAGKQPDHFSAEAREADKLEALHRAARAQTVNPAAAAYAAATLPAPGQFVSIGA